LLRKHGFAAVLEVKNEEDFRDIKTRTDKRVQVIYYARKVAETVEIEE